MVSVDVKQHSEKYETELESCVKVEVGVLGSPSLIVLTVSVDVKQHSDKSETERGLERSCRINN